MTKQGIKRIQHDQSKSREKFYWPDDGRKEGRKNKKSCCRILVVAMKSAAKLVKSKNRQFDFYSLTPPL